MTCMCVYIQIHMNVYVRVYMHDTCAYTHTFEYLFGHMIVDCVYVYIYIYICICIHIYIYVSRIRYASGNYVSKYMSFYFKRHNITY